MKVSETILQNAVKGRFKDEICGVSNVYVYKNESDYLCIHRNGFTTEVEIKISRSDFKADFKKPKHKQYESLMKGSEYWVDAWNPYDGEMSCRLYDVRLLRSSYAIEIHKDKPGYVFEDGKHWFYSEISNWDKKQCSRFAPSSGIAIRKINLPNRFYYLVPHGLIDKSEVPAYAGLMYYNPNAKTIGDIITFEKRCKKIHDKKFDNWKDIAIKLYHRFDHIKYNPQFKLF